MISSNLDGLPDTIPLLIVGSGPVGISLALELESLGQPVVMLESGVDAADDKIQDLSAAEFADPARHDDMSIAVARRLGGTSNLWGGRCLPYDPIDFEARPAMGGELWPIAYSDIAPHFAKASDYLSSGNPVFALPPGHEVSTDKSFTFETLERWSNRPRLQVAHAERLKASKLIDIRLNTSVVGLEFAEDGRVSGVRVVHGSGERRTLKADRVIITAGGLESTRLLLTAQRDNPARFGGVDGPLGRYYMGHVIGEIADVIYADNVLDDLADFYVDEHGSYVRRRFVASEETQREHGLLNCSMWPVSPPVADARHNSGILSMVFLGLSVGPIGRLLIAEAIRKRHVPPGVSWGPHLLNMLRDLPRTAAYIPQFFWKRYGSAMRLPGFFVKNSARRYGLSYHSEQVPNPDSRAVLTDTLDRNGMPRLHIDLRFSEADARSIVRTHELLNDWLVSSKLGRIEYRQAPEKNVDAVLAQAAHGTHQVGLTRMAESPATGVVDKNLATFDAPNLYVASASVLPTSGQANPTFTAVALAVRLAHHLVGKS